jgi:hypothetical protein
LPTPMAVGRGMLLLSIAARAVWSGVPTLAGDVIGVTSRFDRSLGRHRLRLLAPVRALADLGGSAPVLVDRARSRGRFRHSRRPTQVAPGPGEGHRRGAARWQQGGASSERGAPPELVSLVGRRPLAGDHPCRPLSSVTSSVARHDVRDPVALGSRGRTASPSVSAGAPPLAPESRSRAVTVDVLR